VYAEFHHTTDLLKSAIHTGWYCENSRLILFSPDILNHRDREYDSKKKRSFIESKSPEGSESDGSLHFLTPHSCRKTSTSGFNFFFHR
jgi:hypothetical protein